MNRKVRSERNKEERCIGSKIVYCDLCGKSFCSYAKTLENALLYVIQRRQQVALALNSPKQRRRVETVQDFMLAEGSFRIA
jgi:hypothetical protein